MSLSRANDTLKAFKSLLNTKWKCVPICHQCGIDGPCEHTRPFVDVFALQKWMRQRPANVSKNNIELLLEQTFDDLGPDERPIFVQPKNIFEGKNPCVLVFSILLVLEHGHLIYYFQKAGLTDRELDKPDYNRKNLQDQLSRLEDMDREKINNIVRLFNSKKWQFCAPRLTYGMEGQYPRPLTLPFCERRKVNEKGGTASVFQVAIPQDFVSEDIKKRLQPSKSKRFGMCYEFAIKSYSSYQKSTYDRELEAFSGLAEEEGMIRYFGCFEHQQGEFSYHIVLELGQMDLVEYFYKQHPPELSVEIVRFWQSLCEVAKAIRTVHNLPHGSEVYNGWHGDVKPDNILLVQRRNINEWKLADFGFAKFKRAEEDEYAPKIKLPGGTATYGAPEFCSSRTDAEHTQKIDTWSFGCVLSVAATWVILGSKGIECYEELRQQAFDERNENMGAGNMDQFHDEQDVLPEIIHWHRHLRTVIRRSDIVTIGILNLIETSMLKGNASSRLSMDKVCSILDAIVGEARSSLDRNSQLLRPEYTITQPDDTVKEALLTTENKRQQIRLYAADGIKLTAQEQEKNRLQVASYGVRSNRNSEMRRPESILNTSCRVEALKEALGNTSRRNRSASRQRTGVHSANHKSTSIEEGVADVTGERPFLPPQPSVQNCDPKSPAVFVTSDSPNSNFEAAPREGEKGDVFVEYSIKGQMPTPAASGSIPSRLFAEDDHLQRSSDHTEETSLPSSSGKPSSSLSRYGHRTASNATSISIMPPSRLWELVANDHWRNVTEIRSTLEGTANAAHIKNDHGWTLIMAAAQKGCSAMVHALLDYSPRLLEQDNDGMTVLHHLICGRASLFSADSIDEPEDFLQLIDDVITASDSSPSDPQALSLVNMVDNNGRSALWYCACFNMYHSAKRLIKYEAWINPPPGADADDVFLAAVQGQRLEMITLLLENRADFQWDIVDEYNLPKAILFRLEHHKPRIESNEKKKVRKGIFKHF